MNSLAAERREKGAFGGLETVEGAVDGSGDLTPRSPGRSPHCQPWSGTAVCDPFFAEGGEVTVLGDVDGGRGVDVAPKRPDFSLHYLS